MTIAAVRPEMCAEPGADLYPSGMVKRVLLGIQEMRRQIGQLAEAIERREHVVLAKRGKPFAVTVPIEWYRDAAVKMKDPTDY